MSAHVEVPDRDWSRGYQLHVVQEVLLALLAAEASYGYQLRARLQLALGPLGGLTERWPGLRHAWPIGEGGARALAASRAVRAAGSQGLQLTEAGLDRVEDWLRDTSWPKPAPAEFHLKLVAAAAAGLADPVRIVDAQRHALLEALAAAQRAALAEQDDSVAGLLLEGVVLRLQADLRWLEACARFWSAKGER